MFVHGHVIVNSDIHVHCSESLGEQTAFPVHGVQNEVGRIVRVEIKQSPEYDCKCKNYPEYADRMLEHLLLLSICYFYLLFLSLHSELHECM